MEEALERVLRAGQQRGEVRADLDARSLALLVLALLQGLHVVARAEAEPQRLDAVVTAAMAMLARPAAPARRRS
jgi:TetR/AcrR family transcriptional repressor of nem operon